MINGDDLGELVGESLHELEQNHSLRIEYNLFVACILSHSYFCFRGKVDEKRWSIRNTLLADAKVVMKYP